MLVNKVSFVVDNYLVDDVETLVLCDIDATLLRACACGLPHQEGFRTHLDYLKSSTDMEVVLQVSDTNDPIFVLVEQRKSCAQMPQLVWEEQVRQARFGGSSMEDLRSFALTQ